MRVAIDQRVPLSQVKSSRVKSSRVKSRQVESSRVESSRVESSRVESSRVESSRVRPAVSALVVVVGPSARAYDRWLHPRWLQLQCHESANSPPRRRASWASQSLVERRVQRVSLRARAWRGRACGRRGEQWVAVGTGYRGQRLPSGAPLLPGPKGGPKGREGRWIWGGVA